MPDELIDVIMPQLGETVTEGTVTRWLKSVGDPVERDEPLFEVSTDKVDTEVPSPAGGFLAEIAVPEGETRDVGTRLATISASSVARATTAPTTPTPPAPAPTPPVSAPPAPAPPPRAVAHATPPPAPPPPPAPAAAAQTASPPGVLLSPVVRRMLAEHAIDPSEVIGTGVGGRITRADVLNLVDVRSQTSSREAVPTAGLVQAPSAQTDAPVLGESRQVAFAGQLPASPAYPGASGVFDAGAAAGPHDQIVPFTNIRRRTAEHMMRSQAVSAHTLMAIEVDFENVDRLRRSARERFSSQEGISLTYLPFVARAVVEALRTFPYLNSSVGDDALIVHRDINLGIAVDLDGTGLIVPVVHNAEAMTLLGIARKIADLASRARSRGLSADDIVGGTFSISNPGPFGTLITAPIINQPQVAVLSTDGVKRKPVVVEMADGSEGIAIHPVGVLAVTFDHRAVDGAYVARFLAELARLLQGRDWSQEL